MKTTLCLILTLLIFAMFAFVPNIFAQDASPEYVVRMIYFHPNDIEPQKSVLTTLSSLIKDVQKFFADEMERHGFERKTFRLETDENDQLIVHRVIGKFDNTHYYGDPSRLGAAETEINDKIDRSKNVIYLSWIDLYNRNTVEFQISGAGSGSSSKGRVLLHSTNFDFTNIERIPQHHYIRAWTVIAHELGHAFGLNHDFRNDVYIMSYGADQDQLSYCAAKWLSAHHYFNANETAINDNTTIKMLTPEVDSTQTSIRLKFEIADPDGLHHAMLITQAARGLIDCKELSGYSNTVEFVTTNITADSTAVSLGVMDSHGNFKSGKFSVYISSLLAPKVVSIPDVNLSKALREALRLTPTTSITQLDMLKLTTLKISEKQEKRNIPEHQVTDLTGIQHALNLRYLYLRNNQIQDITPIIALKQLKVVDVQNNQISDIISLAALTSVNRLWLSDNQISDVSPLANLTNLQELYLQGNPIKNRKPLFELLEKNSDVKIYLKHGGEPLPVTLSHFRAELTDAGIVLKWTTESEVDNAGFYIYRSEAKDGEFKIVNPSMIQGAGTTGERNEYTWTDTTAKPNTVYYYRIEDVSHAGVRKQLATVRLRGLVSASGKLTMRWANLKMRN